MFFSDFTNCMACEEFDDKQIDSLLDAFFIKYGYDFRQYSRAHIRRRIKNRMAMTGINDLEQMLAEVEKNPLFASQFLQDLSITVTEMFRDPTFYRFLREQVIPVLKTYPFIKIWHAGCATGQEAYSMAILLQEEGLYPRTTIYATDFNQEALNKAKTGVYPVKMMKEYTANYQLAGGKESFANYFTASYEMAIMDQSLKKNIVWANHNLVTDAVFAEVHLVLCRNVLIYFDRDLQKHVHQLFYESLVKGGFLCLGSKEDIRFDPYNQYYQKLTSEQKIYKKKY